MNRELLDEAISKLAIDDVYLHSSTIDTDRKYIPSLLRDEGEIEVQFKKYIEGYRILTLEDENDKKEKYILYDYQVGFRILQPRTEEQNNLEEETVSYIVEVLAKFCASYRMQDEISKEAIDEFAKNNVAYHVWPYWREYASSVVTRLRLPAFAMPLYCILESKEQSE